MQRGFSILEILLSSFVLSSLAVGVLLNLSNSHRASAHAQIQSSDYYAMQRLSALFQRAIDDLDTHRLWLAPKIHTSGRIRFQDDSINPVSVGSRRPNPESDAITAISLSSSEALKVKQQSSDGLSNSLSACAKYRAEIKLAEVRSVIALSPEGLRELLIRSYAPTGAAGCYRLTLNATKSMIAPPCPSCNLANLATIVPVRSIYTIYLDRRGELRYLSHAGERNLESQPLLLESRLKKLKLTLRSSLAIHFLGAEFNFKDTRPRDLEVHNNLARQPHYNLLVQ